ncbi:hypothetical protein DSCA_03220 [Desulfosarcina alkanivorans]|uniref:Uncharacterized protein n=1 Tax=Desulfosarcina alkanivorans TaxID=571177 RepID=A0A5K7YAH6_9BACT|nr:TolC family protein [Desulfosarcina alkanivorans]BBO66392.1 hypothetical protein DSCA_03220 [Desulfosarcina alkanivorans]
MKRRGVYISIAIAAAVIALLVVQISRKQWQKGVDIDTVDKTLPVKIAAVASHEFTDEVSAAREVRSQQEQTRIQRDKMTDHIRLEIRRAFLDLGKAEKNIEAAESALKSAMEAYRQARSGYRAGEGTNTYVLDASTALSRAEANHTQAISDYNIALAALNNAVVVMVERLDIKEKEFAE